MYYFNVNYTLGVPEKLETFILRKKRYQIYTCVKVNKMSFLWYFDGVKDHGKSFTHTYHGVGWKTISFSDSRCVDVNWKKKEKKKHKIYKPVSRMKFIRPLQIIDLEQEWFKNFLRHKLHKLNNQLYQI